MRTNKMVFAFLCACFLLASHPVFAQHAMIGPPPAIQAIETHMQQTRTREQRDAIEQKSAAPVPPRQAVTGQPGDTMKSPAAAKPKALQPSPPDTDSKPPRKQPK